MCVSLLPTSIFVITCFAFRVLWIYFNIYNILDFNFHEFVPLVLTKPLDKLYSVGEQVWYQFHYSFISHWVTRDTSSTLGKVSLVLFISFPTHLCSSLVMDRQSTPPLVYNNNDEFDATKNFIDAKMQAQMEEIKALIKYYKRSPLSSRRRSRAHASELPSPARSHRIDTITDKNVNVKSPTPTTILRLHHLPWHLCQVTSRHLRLRTYDIFAYSTS